MHGENVESFISSTFFCTHKPFKRYQNMSGCGNSSTLLKLYPPLYSTLAKESGTIAPYSLTKKVSTHLSPVSHK